MSPLVLRDILGMFLNTIDCRCQVFRPRCKNLLVPIQLQLSEKPKGFSQLSVRNYRL